MNKTVEHLRFALLLAEREIRSPGTARLEGKDILRILRRAIEATTYMRPPKAWDDRVKQRQML